MRRAFIVLIMIFIASYACAETRDFPSLSDHIEEYNNQQSITGNEILFRGISWDSSLIEAYESLVQQGVMPEGEKTIETSVFSIEPTHIACCMDGGFAIYGLPRMHGIDFQVAGYDVQSLDIHGIKAFTNDYVSDDPLQAYFLSATYGMILDENFEGVEADLVNKLTLLYGEPEIIEKTSNIMTQRYYPRYTNYLWYGANNTCILLEIEKKVYEDRIEYFHKFELTYGRMNCANVITALSTIQATMEERRLAAQIEERAGNYDGL